ncbi:MAG: nuclear transport factor 2 family protein, partial [Bacteroidales bacterium]|nr:nuclear transport factor 2 family protein [Bacteroidales bacterium]
FFDMSSLGGDVGKKTAQRICEEWEEGFKGLDAVQHLAGNYLVTINPDSVDVFAYATATHYKENTTRGKTREFVGSYNLHLVNKDKHWKINRFKYELKYATGNIDLS